MQDELPHKQGSALLTADMAGQINEHTAQETNQRQMYPFNPTLNSSQLNPYDKS